MATWTPVTMAAVRGLANCSTVLDIPQALPARVSPGNLAGGIPGQLGVERGARLAKHSAELGPDSGTCRAVCGPGWALAMMLVPVSPRNDTDSAPLRDRLGAQEALALCGGFLVVRAKTVRQ